MNPDSIVAMLECIHHEDFYYRELFIEDGKYENIIVRILFSMEIIKEEFWMGLSLFMCASLVA